MISTLPIALVTASPERPRTSALGGDDLPLVLMLAK